MERAIPLAFFTDRLHAVSAERQNQGNSLSRPVPFCRFICPPSWPAVRKHRALITFSVQVGIDEPTILGCEGHVLYFCPRFFIRRRSR